MNPDPPLPAAAPAAQAARDASLRGRVRAFQARHAAKAGVLFFVGGFVFDAVMLSRIDEPLMLVQQGGYLLVSGVLLALTQYFELSGVEPPQWLRKPWRYVDHLIHFMLGTLLNAYTIFYFQSASGLTAFGFVLLVAALLALNEMPRFHKLGPVVVYALYSICLTSYFAYLFPVLLGHIRPWMFYVGVGAALLPLTAMVALVYGWSGDLRQVAQNAALPAFGVQLFFVLLYALRVAPPVPLAVKELGVYHEVRREADGWHLLRQKPGWKFWQKSDEEFLERPSDRVYCFARIFAPSHFHDRVDVVWFHDDPRKGWTLFYRKALSVVASSARGFATDAYLTQPPPGAWRVEVQSVDGRTMGQLHFTISSDASPAPRELEEIVNQSAAVTKEK